MTRWAPIAVIFFSCTLVGCPSSSSSSSTSSSGPAPSASQDAALALSDASVDTSDLCGRDVHGKHPFVTTTCRSIYRGLEDDDTNAWISVLDEVTVMTMGTKSYRGIESVRSQIVSAGGPRAIMDVSGPPTQARVVYDHIGGAGGDEKHAVFQLGWEKRCLWVDVVDGGAVRDLNVSPFACVKETDGGAPWKSAHSDGGVSAAPSASGGLAKPRASR